jgi:hypothetical protein
MSVVATLAVASSATAQINFELDNPPSNLLYRGLWRGNPNVRAEQPTALRQTEPSCYYVPGRFNTAIGDAVLSTERGSLIYKLLHSLGQTHSHSGLAKDAQSIRHNTLLKAALDPVTEGGIPVYLKPTGDGGLRDGAPGTITHTVEAATSHREFNLTDGLVMYSVSDGTSLSATGRWITRVTERVAAWNQMLDFRGWYRLYAYTNMTWNDPYARSSNDGNMCSGSIFHAHMEAGNKFWSWDSRRTYSASQRQAAAELLYSEVRSAVLDDPDFLEGVLLGINEFFGGTDYGDFATRAANQVVNCMAFNDCGNRTSRWRNGVGSGRSMSPDDLQMLADVAAFASAFTGNPNTFVYNAVKPLAATGDYYCCLIGQRSGIPTASCERQF